MTMSPLPDYSRKFSSFRGKTLYERLEDRQQVFIRSLAFQHQLTFQEFRQVVEACRDLHMWQEGSLEEWWEGQVREGLQGRGQKKALFKALKEHLRLLKSTPKSYPPDGGFQSLRRKNPPIILRPSGKKIAGMCPVASPKTICCNLRTIDAVENCPLGCSYCTIQTFYRDPIVFDATFAEKLEKIPIDPDRFYHFGTGQSSDSLVWGDRHGNLTTLCQWAARHRNILLEFKTKTRNICYFLENKIPKNVVCSWSLNTPTIIKNEEHLTANLEERLAAARQLADRGIKVAFHFHPMVFYRGWEVDYPRLATQLMNRFEPHEVAFISLGSVTLIKPVIQKIRQLGHPTKILQMEGAADPHGKLTYPDDLKVRLFKTMVEVFHPWRDRVYLYLCMEKASIWREVFGFVYPTNEDFERDFGSRTLGSLSR